MTKKILLIVIILIIIYTIFNINYPVNKEKVVGKYANKNSENPICCLEAPHVPDTLKLNTDGSFISKYYGNGKYDIGKGFETEIEFKCTDSGKELLIRTYFENKLFGKPRIILNADMNHYYEKIE